MLRLWLAFTKCSAQADCCEPLSTLDPKEEAMLRSNTRKTAKSNDHPISRLCAIFMAMTLIICTAAPRVWAAAEMDADRKAFFSVSEGVLEAFGGQIEESYGDADRLMLNYIFRTDAGHMVYKADGEKIRTENYIHGYTLNPSETETIIAIDTYFCKSEPDIEIRISFGEEYADRVAELAWVTDSGEISLDEIKKALVRSDGELTYIIRLDDESLDEYSYYIDHVGENHILRFDDADVDINSVTVVVNDGCYAAVRGMETDLEYIESSAVFYDEASSDGLWAAAYEVGDAGAAVKLIGTESTDIAWEDDGYALTISDGIDAETAAAMAERITDALTGDGNGVQDAIEDDVPEDVIIDITDGASMLYLDSYVFIDTDETRRYTQKASELYYDAQINIFGTRMYISSVPDGIGSAVDYLGSVFDEEMADGTVGIIVARLENEAVAGKLVLELPVDAQMRFAKGDGTGYDPNAEETADTGTKQETKAQTSQTSSAETTATETSTAEITAAETTAAETTPAETSQEETTSPAEAGEAEASAAETETTAETEAPETAAAAETTETEAAADKTSESKETDTASADIDIADTDVDTETAADTNDDIDIDTDIEADTDIDTDADTTYTTAEKLTTTEYVLSPRFLRRASYCAVAQDMTICAVYDEDGRLKALADGYTTDDIAAYILLMSADEDVMLSRIDIIYSDVVAAEVGQEYASLIMSGGIDVKTVINRFIDYDTRLSELLDIEGEPR